jgi:hypothetical protein
MITAMRIMLPLVRTLMAEKSKGALCMEPDRSVPLSDAARPADRREALRIRRRASLYDRRAGVFLVLYAVLLMFAGCATMLPTDVQRTPSTAFADYDSTTTGRLFEEAALQHPGQSGFALIRKGQPAFTGRIAMTAMAEKSLDLQYYIWEADTTGRILALRLVEAADRGGSRPYTGGRQHPFGP